MFQVQCLNSTTNKATEFYSKYSIGPFLKGQSTTVGNALRRVLLSNLQGLAITGVRITGIDHEFSTIPNVKEDVVDILLNLKQIVIKGNITEPILARLNVKEPGIIVADNIELPDSITFVDPRQYIASLTAKGNLEMEFLIARGQNYFTSGKLDYTIPERFLAVDAVFMPVTKVNFFVETSRNSSSFELESLILEIWTNGSIMPDEALSTSAEILENTFGLLKVTDTFATTSPTIETPVQEEKNEHLETIFIEELELSVRAYNCLKRANVHTLSDLLKYSATDLLEFKNFGQKSADEVCENLKTRFDLNLRS
ncbi:MAG: DNA-directed RNA polymerase subunit alpha [Stappia sp.]|jgi:DNA-directed RNA polymerase subunit alpha|nr:DNA-directed RNA polymerase subunit alpha [Stappia sp.]|tara:strand:+ start:841 stop:1776 length:936 start_codon:yes stop_codon:yes gene_type:complete